MNIKNNLSSEMLLLLESKHDSGGINCLAKLFKLRWFMRMDTEISHDYVALCGGSRLSL